MAYNLLFKSNTLQFTFLMLILWTLAGFVFTTDNNTQWGCVDDNATFSFHNISLTALSLAFISFGYLYRKEEAGRWLIVTEAVFWTYKLFFMKGGYVVGLGGGMPFSMVLFDFAGLTLRLLLIKYFFSLPYQSFFALVIAAVLMILKIQFFR